jgi:hypothetical protein
VGTCVCACVLCFFVTSQVVDTSPALAQLWGHVDSQALSHIVTESVDTLFHHWATFLQVGRWRSAPVAAYRRRRLNLCLCCLSPSMAVCRSSTLGPQRDDSRCGVVAPAVGRPPDRCLRCGLRVVE